jgi:predicted O-linked N-acetylglucosamine transferase (SPINDLY family)
VIDSWINVLKKTKNSYLWLYSKDSMTTKNLTRYYNKSGLPEDRLIIAQKIKFDSHLERLRHVDIGLDTRIYTGGATTANLLWKEVPVVTIYGKHFLSRMSSSILTNTGLKELITKDLNEYTNLVINLVKSPKKLKILKKKIKQNITTYPLFDSKKFTQDFENLIESVANKY